MILRSCRDAWRAMSGVSRFNALPSSERSIVFYAEDAASWVHLGPIVTSLVEHHRKPVCYLTSSRTDPILQSEPAGIRAIYVGAGAARTALFLGLKAGMLVMTMPDLGTFHIKRSATSAVHYVYVFHSMVSTHMIYRRGAFDQFDTVLCVGPHHAREIRATEARDGLPAKNLVEHGYGRLDALLEEVANNPAPQGRTDAARRVLVAPSWGNRGLLETCGTELCALLRGAGYHVTVRPHPMSERRCANAIAALKRRFGDDPGFVLEGDVASSVSLHSADLMISDWSGVALEYAFAREQPVLFIDVPRKVNNPDYGDVPCDPIEVTLREEIGEVVSPEHLGDVPKRLEVLWNRRAAMREHIREVRARTVFNLGTSGTVGAAHIARLAEQSRQAPDRKKRPRPKPIPNTCGNCLQ